MLPLQGITMDHFQVDFELFKKLSHELLDKIKSKNSIYSAILCPLRGGFYLSDFMSRQLKLPVFYLEISSYRKKEQTDFYIGIKPEIFSGKILICDDIYDSGKTMKSIYNMYPHADFDAACIISKTESKDIIYGLLVEKEKWVDFFWELV